MKIDVFTLFPQWFDWFRGQRHVANVLAGGSALELIDIREHTPLGGRPGRRHPLRGRRRDAAAGGRTRQRPAGALRGRPRAPARAPAGDRAGAQRAAARRPARRRAGRRGGADPAVRPLRGLRRAHPRALRQRRHLDRALRAQRRRAARDGALRRGHAQAPRSARGRALGAGGVLQRRPGRPSRVPPLHAPRRVPRLAGPGRAALRPPRTHRAVAPGAEPGPRRREGARASPDAAAGF